MFAACLIVCALSAGCQKTTAEEAAKVNVPPPATLPAGRQAEAQQIQNNPNIPPEAKAVITSRMQGKGDTPPPAPPK